jgi:hypothetical protein
VTRQEILTRAGIDTDRIAKLLASSIETQEKHLNAKKTTVTKDGEVIETEDTANQLKAASAIQSALENILMGKNVVPAPTAVQVNNNHYEYKKPRWAGDRDMYVDANGK